MTFLDRLGPSLTGRIRISTVICYAARGKRKVVARSRWDAAHVDVTSSASWAGVMMPKTGQPSSPGSVARGLS